MNNKDREALNKFIEEDTLSLDDPYLVLMSDEERAAFIAGQFFEAGAKHGRAELQEELLLYKEAARSEAEFVNELTSVLDLKKETIVEMQNAYETLNAHDEMLIATVDKLERENKSLRAFVNCLAYADANAIGATQIYINNARQILKDIGEE